MDATFTQQNIGKFVNINKTNKDEGVGKGDTQTGTEAVDHNRAVQQSNWDNLEQ